MPLFASFAWVIVGIVYVIYRILKDEPQGCLTGVVVLLGLTPFGMMLYGGAVAEEGGEVWFWSGIILAVVELISFLLYVYVYLPSKDGAAQTAKNKELYRKACETNSKILRILKLEDRNLNSRTYCSIVGSDCNKNTIRLICPYLKSCKELEDTEVAKTFREIMGDCGVWEEVFQRCCVDLDYTYINSSFSEDKTKKKIKDCVYYLILRILRNKELINVSMEEIDQAYQLEKAIIESVCIPNQKERLICKHKVSINLSEKSLPQNNSDKNL